MSELTKKSYENIGETLYSGVLGNGLRLRILTKPGYKKSFAFFATDYGGADRRFRINGEWIDTPAGVAHFLEHKMFDTEDGNALAILSANGASPNAYTSSGITAYFFESTQGFYENLRVLLSFVSVPYFTAESVQKERGIIGQEIRMIEDEPEFIVYQNLMRLLYQHHPIRDSVAGSIESIAEITEQTLYDCHEIFYNPSNMALCVAGDIDPEKILELAKEILKADKGERPERDYGGTEPETIENNRSEAVMEVSEKLFALGAKFIPGDNALKERLIGDIALSCLAGRTSPLYIRLYAEGLINGSFAVEADYSAKTAVIIAAGESRDPDAVLREFLSECAEYAKNGPPEKLFERIRRAVYGSKLRELESFSSICHELAVGCFEDFDPLAAFDILEQITAADIQKYISDKLQKEKIAVSVVKPGQRGE